MKRPRLHATVFAAIGLGMSPGWFAGDAPARAAGVGAIAADEARRASLVTLGEPSEAEAAGILAVVGDREEHVWLDGDVLHFAHRNPEGQSTLTGGLQMPMSRLGETDLWIVRLRGHDLSKAIVSYDFFGPGPPDLISLKVWRGDDAPNPPASDKNLHFIESFRMESAILGEQRGVTVVLPPGYNPGERRSVPAIVLADGQAAEVWGRILRPLIDAGRMRPVAIVGIHSAGYRGEPGEPFDPRNDYRAREYLESEDPERFALHLRWVLEEVLPTVAERFGVSTRREDLALAGFSNGGVFAATAGLRAPDRFGSVMAFSIGVALPEERPHGSLPRFYLGAGALERGFLRGTTLAKELIAGWGEPVRMQTFVMGHDPALWDLLLSVYAPEIFPAHSPRDGQGSE